MTARADADPIPQHGARGQTCRPCPWAGSRYNHTLLDGKPFLARLSPAVPGRRCAWPVASAGCRPGPRRWTPSGHHLVSADWASAPAARSSVQLHVRGSPWSLPCPSLAVWGPGEVAENQRENKDTWSLLLVSPTAEITPSCPMVAHVARPLLLSRGLVPFLWVKY